MSCRTPTCDADHLDSNHCEHAGQRVLGIAVLDLDQRPGRGQATQESGLADVAIEALTVCSKSNAIVTAQSIVVAKALTINYCKGMFDVLLKRMAALQSELVSFSGLYRWPWSAVLWQPSSNSNGDACRRARRRHLELAEIDDATAPDSRISIVCYCVYLIFRAVHAPFRCEIVSFA